MSNTPRTLRLFSAPRQVFREAARSSGGLAALCGYVALELFMVHPGTWVGSSMRLKGAPGAALGTLYTSYTQMVLPPLVAVGAAGVLHYYVQRWRKHLGVDFGAAASAFGYTYFLHTLLVAMGVSLAACGWDNPWLPQYSVAVLDENWQRWVKLALAYGPSAALGVVAWRALTHVKADPAETTPLRPWVSALTVGPVVVGLLVTLVHIGTHWQELRPSNAGDPLPAFSVKGINRPDLSEADFAGHPAVIDFWATWCPPCIASLPHIQALSREFEAKGVRFAAVNIESDNRAGVEGFLAAQKLTLPVYLDADGKMQERFHIHMYPTTWIVDAAGHVNKIYSGPASPAEMRERLEGLLTP